MKAMTDRERFLATMHYQPVDRGCICDFGFWPETIVLWHDQGLPAHVGGGHDTTSTDKWFGMDVYTGGPGVNNSLVPHFKEEVIEDRGDHELVRQTNGVTVLRKKFMGSIPEHHGHLLVDRASWNQHYKPKLDPTTPERWPDWAEARKVWQDPDRTYPNTIGVGSLYGWIRDLMGVEAVSYIVYDDPGLFEEMVTTLADLTIACLNKTFENGGRFDTANFWEDMCYSGGPLLSPEHFKKYLVPHYRRICDLLRKHGVDIVWLDCDGKIDELIPMWLDAGVNCMFPIEVGTWHADPVAFRKKFGKSLLLMGGVSKHILSSTPQEIDAEVKRLLPLVESGGYIPMPDHRVPPDVPLKNYYHYLRTARRIWGKGINLKPVEWE